MRECEVGTQRVLREGEPREGCTFCRFLGGLISTTWISSSASADLATLTRELDRLAASAHTPADGLAAARAIVKAILDAQVYRTLPKFEPSQPPRGCLASAQQIRSYVSQTRHRGSDSRPCCKLCFEVR